MEGQDNPARTQEDTVKTVPPTEAETVKTEKTYSQEEFSKMQSTFEKKEKQAKREAQEAQHQLESTTASITAMQEQISKLTEEIERRELEGLEDVPQGQKLIRLNTQLRQREAQLLKQQADFSTKQKEALEGLKFKDALNLSKEYGIDVDELMDCNSMKDMYEKVAKSLKEKTVTPKTEEKPKPKVPEHIDSGLSTSAGKGKNWKGSEINNMSSDERFANRKEIAAAMREGRIDQTK